MKSRYYLTRILGYLLAFLLSFSIIIEIFGIVTMSTVASPSFIASKLQVYESEIRDKINTRFELVFENEEIPARALEYSLSDEQLDELLNSVAEDFTLGTDSDFSYNEALYSSMLKGLGKYCRENNISLSSEKMSNITSLAVDTVNEVFSSISTSDIALFKLTRSNTMVAVVVISGIMIAALIALISYVNKGRHIKYIWTGMGITVAGYILLFVPLFVVKMNYVADFGFCDYDIYNRAISDALESALKICLPFGAFFSISGITMLAVNYRYFKNKNTAVKQVRDETVRLMDEYMEQYTKSKLRKDK